MASCKGGSKSGSSGAATGAVESILIPIASLDACSICRTPVLYESFYLRATSCNCTLRSGPLNANMARQQNITHSDNTTCSRYVRTQFENGSKIADEHIDMTRLVCRCTLSVHSDFATRAHGKPTIYEGCSKFFHVENAICAKKKKSPNFSEPHVYL